MRSYVRPVLAALCLMFALPGEAAADRRRGDHDDARHAVERREALPLARILAAATRAVPGEVLEVELERDDGRLLYEIEILARNGRVRTVTLDAATAAILDVEDDD